MSEPNSPLPARSPLVGGATGDRFFQVAFSLPLAVGVLVALHVGFGHPGIPLSAQLGAATLGALAVAIIRRARPTRIPFLPFAAAQYYLFYGMPTFSEPKLSGANGRIFVSHEAISSASWAAVLTLAAMWAASFAGHLVGAPLRPTLERFTPRSGILRLRGAIRLWALCALVLRGVVLFRLGGLASSPFAFAVSIVASPLLIQALLHREWQESKSPVSRLWFSSFTAAAAVLGMGTGMLVEVVVPLLGALVLNWLASGKVRVRLLLVLAIAYFVLAPAKHQYRRDTWDPVGKTSTQVTIADRATAWLEALEASWGGERTDVRENVDTGTSRVSALLYAAQTFDWVPTYVPFTGASRWPMIAYSYVPRLIWKDKPDMTRYYNATYAVTFDLLSERGTRTTAVGFFLISDGYWAFGWPGVVLVGVLVGFLFGVYEALFVPRHWALLAIGFVFLMSLQMVAHLASLWTGIAQAIFALLLGIWIIWGVAYFLSERRPFLVR